MSRFPQISQLCALAFAIFCIGQTAGETVYDNGAPNHDPLPNGFEMTQWIQANDFDLATPTRVDSVTFWDVEIAGNFQGTIYWSIYINSADDTPGTLLYSGLANASHVATGYSSVGYVEYQVSFSIPPAVLAPGTYWLTLHNGPLSVYTYQRVYWESTGAIGARPSEDDIGPFFAGNWRSDSVTPESPSEDAFQLGGAAAPRISAVMHTSAQAQISFTTSVGYNYRLEYKNNLSDSAWTTVAGAATVAGTGGIVQVSDSDPNLANLKHRFYRAVLL